MKLADPSSHAARTSLVLLSLALAVWALPGPERSSEPAHQDALSASTDAGRVVDREGLARRKALYASRWTVASANAPVEPGDWLETGARGANALLVRLAGGAELLLGPGTRVEVTDGRKVRLSAGELRIAADEESAAVVAGPGDAEIRVSGRTVLRARDGNLVRLDEDPRWLTGYEAGASTEALGSLLANVDGRNIPLTIGYHKVTVDVRDQIARTVIEESFVNHTDTILEGVFYFPLPADASISGFGMWIGGELVQGDIVEKQRARSIYETILREKRDPGLLEWSGGNVFKARVFPIGAEKRIRISYTQVLPKEGDTYVYRYALQSELLRQHPLERLSIEVNVASKARLEGVRVTSHECRVRTGEHSAHVELEAEEYSPDRDFELEITSPSEGGAVTAVPHRRGDDGYFMLLVDAPEPRTDVVQEETVPFDVLVLADTSGSTFGPAREAQVAFIEALLSGLGTGDRFDLATCDTEVRWAFGELHATRADERAAAMRFLEAREPLGWSDLDRAFAAAIERAGPLTHVIYVGDGHATAGDADPVAVAQRLKRAYRGQGTFHAVVPGNRSEPAVLRALASLGGGSVRTIGGTDPVEVAFDLAREIESPSVKDLALEVDGVSVAAVYPEVLPNLPLGTQQVIVGRYDALSRDTRGKVRITGSLQGRPIAFESEIELDAQGDEGSFVPRLWARRHLDHLLDQGRTPGIAERVIALSEDFQVITPYTSFLVLESDADRERFGVERSFRMRDGEEFFAEGREDARYELVRRQMLAAKGWRTRLRAKVLAALAGMNRELTEALRGGVRRDASVAFGLGGWEQAGSLRGRFESKSRRDAGADDYFLGQGEPASPAPSEFQDEAGEPWTEEERLADLDTEQLLSRQLPRSPAVEELFAVKDVSAMRQNFAGRRELATNAFEELGYAGSAYDTRYGPDPFQSLFPSVAPPREADPDWPWDPEVVEAISKIDYRRKLAASDAEWLFDLRTTYHDPYGREQVSRGGLWLGRGRWAAEPEHVEGTSMAFRWLADGRRGVMRTDWQLARTREAVERDAASWPAPFAWNFGDELRQFTSYDAALEESPDGRTRVVFTLPTQPGTRTVLELERERGVLVEKRLEVDGEIRSRLIFEHYRRIGGLWWPAQVRTWNADQAAYSVTTVAVEDVGAEAFERSFADAMRGLGDSIELPETLPELAEAKQAAAEGRAGTAECWVLLQHQAASGQWDGVREELDALDDLEAGKPGRLAIRLVWLQQSRRNEALRQLVLLEASALSVRRPGPEYDPYDADYTVAQHLIAYAGNFEAGQERLELLEALEPVFDREAERLLDAKYPLDQQRVAALQAANRPAETRLALLRMTRDYPYHVEVWVNLANEKARLGEFGHALDTLAEAERRDPALFLPGTRWLPYELLQLRRATTRILWDAYRLPELVDRVSAWMELGDEGVDSGILNQYLTALVYLDREEESLRQTRAWLREYRGAELETFELYRLQAAIQVALGNGYALGTQRIDDGLAELLAETADAIAHLDGAPHVYLAGQILTHWRFRDTDAGREISTRLYRELVRDAAEMPALELSNLVGWLHSSGFSPAVDETQWPELLESVFERRTATADEDERRTLAQVVLSWGGHDLQVALRRRELEESEPGAERAGAARTLFHALMGGAWSPEVEEELWGLLPRVAETDGPPELRDQRMRTRILALYDLTGWLPEARAQVVVAALPDVNAMPRRRLAAEHEKALREARAKTAERLSRGDLFPGRAELRPWVRIERAWLDVRTHGDLEAARGSSMGTLSALFEEHTDAETAADVPLADRVLAARCAATLANLLAHDDVETRAEHEGAFTSLLERGIESDSKLVDARETLYMLLVALDRGDALEQRLEAWYGGGEEFARMRWGRDLAHVAAERGDLERAVALLEEIERIDELDRTDYEALADWYTALDRRDDAREARFRAWETQPENVLGNELQSESHPYRRSGNEVPPELDPEIPTRFVALMHKATRPENWIWVLRSYYEPTQDFRLLECLPEAVLGHTAQAIYPFLEGLDAVATSIHEEATVDRFREHLEVVRAERAHTDVDRRALQLMQFMIVQGATRQANGAEDHARTALHAMREAFKGEWSEGEPVLMARFLANRGALEPAALEEEQLRQLRELLKAATHPSDRYSIAEDLAETTWNHGRREEAVRTLESALDRLREASEPGHGARLPDLANPGLERLSSWLQALGSYEKAAALWRRELGGDVLPARELWAEQHLAGVYCTAVLVRAELSLGSGPELYRAVHERFLTALRRRTNERHAAALTELLCDLWRRAHRELHYSGLAGDALDFAFSTLPEVLDLYQYRNGQRLVSNVATCLDELQDARTALQFLTVRAENEPSWLQRANQDFWPAQSNLLGDLRSRASSVEGGLGRALETRVLAIVLRELRADLGSRLSRNRAVYDRRYHEYWSEKREDFLRAALGVLEEHADSGASVVHVAEYLFRGLDAWDEAIDALLAASRRGLLDLGGRTLLATFLQERGRWRESIPVLEALVVDAPGEVNHRVMLVRAHFRLGQLAERAQVLAEAETWLREAKSWTERPIAALAAACVETELPREAIRLYGEAIELHAKSAPFRGVGDGVLSGYYRTVASAHSQLGDTDAAVDACAGAIVSWGGNDVERQRDLDRLEEILFAAEDLDTYVARLDAESRRTGLENPILRKALGNVYARRHLEAKAIVQLRRALETQPDDLETHLRLVEVLDAAGRPAQAAEAQLAGARVAENPMDLLVDLGRRWSELEREADAERARTELVEIRPNESESHAALAEVRERQGRWREAADEWRQVIRLRTDEPEGYLRLLRVQVELGDRKAAEALLDEIVAREWAERFGDVRAAARRTLAEPVGR